MVWFNFKPLTLQSYSIYLHALLLFTMLIKQSYKDVKTTANGKEGTIRIYVIEPNVPEYPEAKFPGCQFFLIRHHVSREIRDAIWLMTV